MSGTSKEVDHMGHKKKGNGHKQKKNNGNRSKKTNEDRLKNEKKVDTKIIVGVIIAAIVLVAIGAFVYYQYSSQNDTEYEDTVIDETGDNVIINMAELEDGEFHYYEYEGKSSTIKFFALIDDEGEVHTAFDACEVCYHAKKGYEQSGDEARCRNCGQKFSVKGIGTENKGGGCWPGYLPHTIDGSRIIIKTEDLETGSHFF